MQSTSNTGINTSLRPKIGRPPALPPAASAPPEAPEKPRKDPRLLVFSVCLVVAMTLVLSRVITPGMETATAEIPSIPPIVVNAPEVVYASASKEPALIGTLTTMGADDTAETMRAEETTTPSIDKRDRERLLSILSKN